MTVPHTVRVWRSDDVHPREDQLAYRLATVAADPVTVTPEVTDMVINRIIDNAAVALASLRRDPVVAARAQARAHPATTGGSGGTVFGTAVRTAVEWAAWANSVAVRELDFHDTFLAAEYSHPGDNIPPLIAVAQHVGASGADLVRAIATGYEVQISLASGICLHAHRIDHVAHLGPSVAAGLGTLLHLDADTTFQAIGQALHTTTATRQSRKGEISSWKAFAPAFAGKAAIEAVDRAVRGQAAPVPIYEGEDGVLAWLLDGPDAEYVVPLPAPGEPKRAILDSYTKEHSAEYQAQAWIDLARRLHAEHPELLVAGQIRDIVLHTSHHTHAVIGSGAGDPQKYSPTASRETLDHSLPFIFAVALQDGTWHHVDSYTPERAARADTVALWRSIRTVEDPEWTRRYHSADLSEKAFGGRAEITLTDGTVLNAEIAVADAHPLGARPFGRAEYVHKLRTLAEGVADPAAVDRFLDAVESLPELTDLDALIIPALPGLLDPALEPKGLF